MNKVLLAATALAALGGGTTAVLAGSPASAPAEPVVAAPPPAFNWTGAYAGLHLGYLDGDLDALFVSPPAPAPWSGSPKPDGAVGGIYGGYNWQGSGPMVWGVEGEVNLADAKGCCAEQVGGTPTAWSFQSKVDMTAALRLRVGYANGRTLFYAAGGVAYADFELRYIDAGGGLRDTVSDGRTGWTLGLGVEHAFANNWVGRIDYRYSDFGSDTYNINEGGGIYPADIDLTTGEIRVGVAMRF